MCNLNGSFGTAPFRGDVSSTIANERQWHQWIQWKHRRSISANGDSLVPLAWIALMDALMIHWRHLLHWWQWCQWRHRKHWRSIAHWCKWRFIGVIDAIGAMWSITIGANGSLLAPFLSPLAQMASMAEFQIVVTLLPKSSSGSCPRCGTRRRQFHTFLVNA